MIDPISRIGQTYRNISRYREILSVLARHGFGDLITNLRLERYLDFSKKYFKWPQQVAHKELSRSERICLALEDLGPTFIKLGQVMSNRPDLLPEEFIVALERLQDRAPVFSSDEAIKTVERELKDSLVNLFHEFETEPVASASISQVHRAVLHSGERVAVKIQRPGLNNAIKTDVEIMYHLASLMERYLPGLEALEPMKIVEEFDNSIGKELDFTIEAYQMERFREVWKSDPRFCVPRIYSSHSSQRVLVTEWIDGIKVTHLQKLKESNIDASQIAKYGAQIILKQIFEHGFFHGDPHPGNILIRPGPVICFLDFGVVGSLSQSQKEYFISIITALVEKDSEKVARALSRISLSPVDSLPNLEKQVSEILEQYSYLPLKNLNMGELLHKFLKLITENDLRILPGFYLLLKALITIEGVGRKLDPDFDLIVHMTPFVRHMVRQRLSPKRLLRDAYLSALDLSPLLRDLPSESREMLNLLKRGKLRIEFAHKNLEPMLRLHDIIVNRLVFAMVLAALIIGSSLVVLSGIPPKWYGVPLIGLIGFTSAGLIGFGLLFSMVRRGRL